LRGPELKLHGATKELHVIIPGGYAATDERTSNSVPCQG
jgi:hypothetical protein